MPAGDAGLAEAFNEAVREASLRIWHERGQLRTEVDRLQAQLAAQQAVVDAARGVLNCVGHGGQEAVWHHQADGACLDLLDKALAKAQAAQPEGER